MEAINWDAVGALSEAFGVIAVVASLIFVGFQIRHNAQATKTASVNNIMGAWCDMYLRFSENENYASTIWNGSQDPTSLSGVDQWRLSMAFTAFFQLFHNAYYQWKAGAYESKEWYAHMQFLRNILTLPGAQVAWKERKSIMPDDFRIYVEEKVLTKAPDPNYKLPGT